MINNRTEALTQLRFSFGMVIRLTGSNLSKVFLTLLHHVLLFLFNPTRLNLWRLQLYDLIHKLVNYSQLIFSRTTLTTFELKQNGCQLHKEDCDVLKTHTVLVIKTTKTELITDRLFGVIIVLILAIQYASNTERNSNN